MPLETIGGIADIRLRPCDATRLHLDVPVTGMRKTLLAGRMGYPLAVAARRRR